MNTLTRNPPNDQRHRVAYFSIGLFVLTVGSATVFYGVRFLLF